jgi:hypothetical protein
MSTSAITWVTDRIFLTTHFVSADRDREGRVTGIDLPKVTLDRSEALRLAAWLEAVCR